MNNQCRNIHRETVSTYQLVVVAQDQGIPPRSASVEVKVTVDDDNDHAPDFGRARYSETLYDSSTTSELFLSFLSFFSSKYLIIPFIWSS